MMLKSHKFGGFRPLLVKYLHVNSLSYFQNTNLFTPLLAELVKTSASFVSLVDGSQSRNYGMNEIIGNSTVVTSTMVRFLSKS